MQFRTKEDQIADFLREEIISGRIPRGARLKQQEVAERLNTSITPVREALKLLKAEGYLCGASHQGLSVVPFDTDATAEIRDLRILLEGQLVEQAIRNITASDIEKLRTLAADFEAAADDPDSSRARGLNYRFHQRIYEVAKLPQTLYFVQVLWARYPFDLINNVQGRVESSANEHAELLRNLVEGDAVNALLSLRRHIDQGWLTLRQVIENTPPGNTTHLEVTGSPGLDSISI